MFKKKLNKYNLNFSEYKKEKSDLSYYNLPNDVVFCKTCLMSNQKPVQTIEHTSQVSDQKTTLDFLMEFVMRVDLSKLNKMKLIGKKENLNLESYLINIEVEMDLLIS